MVHDEVTIFDLVIQFDILFINSNFTFEIWIRLFPVNHGFGVIILTEGFEFFRIYRKQLLANPPSFCVTRENVVI